MMAESEASEAILQARAALREDETRRAQAAAAAYEQAVAGICRQYGVRVRYGWLTWADGGAGPQIQFVAVRDE